MTCRTLRRGFGCRYAGKVPAQILQKLMRHSNISITMMYYANVDDAVMDAVRGDEGAENAPRRNARRNKSASGDQGQTATDGASEATEGS